MKVMRFLGMPIYKTLSDTEFVEKTRKALRLSKKVVWLHIAFIVICSVYIPKLYDLFYNYVKSLPDDAQVFAWIGLVIGIVAGWAISSYLGFVCVTIIIGLNLFNFNRKDKLMIKYHDHLKEIDPQYFGEEPNTKTESLDFWQRENIVT